MGNGYREVVLLLLMNQTNAYTSQNTWGLGVEVLLKLHQNFSETTTEGVEVLVKLHQNYNETTTDGVEVLVKLHRNYNWSS